MPSIRSSIRGGFLALGLVAVALLALFLGQGGAPTAHAQGPSAEGTPQKQEAASLAQLRQRFLADQQAAQPLSPLAAQPCVGGTAAGYPCQNVDLMSFLPLASIGGGNGNDIWGWTDCARAGTERGGHPAEAGGG